MRSGFGSRFCPQRLTDKPFQLQDVSAAELIHKAHPGQGCVHQKPTQFASEGFGLFFGKEAAGVGESDGLGFWEEVLKANEGLLGMQRIFESPDNESSLILERFHFEG